MEAEEYPTDTRSLLLYIMYIENRVTDRVFVVSHLLTVMTTVIIMGFPTKVTLKIFPCVNSGRRRDYGDSVKTEFSLFLTQTQTKFWTSRLTKNVYPEKGTLTSVG